MGMHSGPVAANSPPTNGWDAWLAANVDVFFLYARQQTRTASDAEDVLQEALAESWRRAGGLPPDRALVFTTIRRRAVDLGRSSDRRAAREDRFAGDAPLWVSPDYSASDTSEQLASAVEQLPDKLREILTLRVWGGMSFPAIAELVEAPVTTVTSRYRYALDRLRESTRINELRP